MDQTARVEHWICRRQAPRFRLGLQFPSPIPAETLEQTVRYAPDLVTQLKRRWRSRLRQRALVQWGNAKWVSYAIDNKPFSYIVPV